jgi:hypothetical protein
VLQSLRRCIVWAFDSLIGQLALPTTCKKRK